MTLTASCRVCGTSIAEPTYRAAAPALTSIMTTLESETLVHVCPGCSHAQCPDMPEIETFYDTEYRISLEADDHDQLFGVGPDGQPLFRTDHQAAISLRMLDLAPGALILDYGAAKSDTLRKMMGLRPDIVPHVFDVSSDYAIAWDGWVLLDHQATYRIDEHWRGRFDAVTSYFAIEHVADPMAFLAQIRALLQPGGQLLLALPDVHGNPGDMIVVDHLNHFTNPSIRYALEASGFTVDAVNVSDFPGAFFIKATACEGSLAEPVAGVAEAMERNAEICHFWERAHGLIAQAGERMAGQRCAIYGAGFYGSWIARQVSDKMEIVAFLDQNPNLQGSRFLGVPVVNPAALDDSIRTIFIGLNPRKARAIIDSMPLFQGRDLDFVWLD